MVRFNRAVTLTAALCVSSLLGVAQATELKDAGSFVVANMAPPEPLPPPAKPAATPDAPAAPDAAPAAPEAAPEAAPAPADGAAPPAAPADEPLPPPDQSSPPAGMGTKTIIGIVAALLAAGIGGFWFMRRR